MYVTGSLPHPGFPLIFHENSFQTSTCYTLLLLLFTLFLPLTTSVICLSLFNFLTFSQFVCVQHYHHFSILLFLCILILTTFLSYLLPEVLFFECISFLLTSILRGLTIVLHPLTFCLCTSNVIFWGKYKYEVFLLKHVINIVLLFRFLIVVDIRIHKFIVTVTVSILEIVVRYMSMY